MFDYRRKISKDVTRSDISPREIEAGETVSVRAMDTEYDLDSLLDVATKLGKTRLLQANDCGHLIDRLKDPQCLRQLLDVMPPEPLVEAIFTRGRIGQFELLESLGSGGMGEVFKARHLQLGRIVAVKMLHSHRLSDPLAIRRFRQEIRTVGQLQHPHLVSASHADEENGLPYLVMDYVPGLSLRQLVDKLEHGGQRMTVGAACEMIRQAAIGVQFAHESGIIHRDLKPNNLMLDPFGLVRVLDLGLAKVTSSAEPLSFDLTACGSMTGENGIVGTPDYMAPEQIRESCAADERTDVYALGATLFRLLTGQVLYPSMSSSDGFLNKAVRILQDPVPDIRCFRDDVDSKLAVVLDSCLAKKPADRIPSARVLAERLAVWSDPVQVRALAESLNLPQQSAAAGRGQETSIAPAAAVSGSTPTIPLNRVLWIAGSLLPLFLAGWLIYRLSLPSGGELVVQCVDDVQVTIRAVQEENVESLELIREPTGRLALGSGPWRLSLQGLDAEQYALSEDEIVITSGGQPRVRVTRIADSRVEPGVTLPPALQPSSQTQPDANPNRMFLPGLVQRPASHNALFDWQLLLKRPLSGMQLDAWKWSVRHFDVARDGSHWVDSLGSHVLVRNCQSGEVTALVTAAHRGDFFHAVVFHPTGDYFAVLVHSLTDQRRKAIEVRSSEGLLQQRISYSEQLPSDTASSRECFAWSGDGTSLFVWNVDRLLAYDRSGRLLQKLDFADSTQGAAEFAVSVCSDHASARPNTSELTVLCDDAVIRTWDIATGAVRELGPVGVSTLPEGLDVSLKWSPDGTRLLVACRDESGDNRLAKILRVNGAVVATHQRDWEQADWSSDGELLVTDQGQLLDQELQTIRELPTATHDPAPGVRRHPFWTDREDIVLVYADARWQKRSGMIRRFRASGAELPTSSDPQPLQPMAADLLNDDRIAVVYHRGGTHRVLFHWSPTAVGSPASKLPELAPSGAELQPSEAAFSSTNNQIVLRSPHHQFILSTEGSLIRETFLETDDRLDAAYQPNGNWLAFVQKSDASLVIQDTEGNTVRTISPASDNAKLSWSPNGRFLAWQHPSSDREHSVTSVIELQKPDAQPVLLGDTRGRFSFSPNSEWLAGIASEENSAKLIATELLSVRHLEVPLSVNPFVRSSPLWMSDSRQVFAGQMFRIDNGESLERVGEVAMGDWMGGVVSSSVDNLVVSVNPSPGSPALCAVDVAGSLVRSTSMAGPLLPAVINGCSNQSPRESSRAGTRESSRAGNCVLLAADANLMEPYGVSLVSLDHPQAPTPLWAGVAFDDGTALGIDASGRVLPHPYEVDLDKYVLHMIRYPNGPSIPLTHREFALRLRLTEDQLALVWAQDVAAHVERGNGEAWDIRPRDLLLSQANDQENFPLASEITLLDLSDNQELSDIELQFVAKFSGIKQLLLTNTPIRDLMPLAGLIQLEVVDLAHSQVDDLSHLAKLAKLRKLSVANTLVAHEDLFHLAACENLEELDLSETAVDLIALRELKGLTKLRRLNLSGCELSAVAIESLRKLLPDCKILSRENEQ
jgi:serine/threonine protein kinase/WD40 repeat protein/Leucine-rich repeat (LRR) protein